MGKWSYISVYNMPVADCLLRILLQNILSINVAEVLVTLVGLVMVGNRENEYFSSRNSELGKCLSMFSKLLL